MRIFLFVLLTIIARPAVALTINFNDLALAPNSYASGPMPNATTVAGPFGPLDIGSFTSGGAQFGNTFDETFGSWGGFAYSSTTDTTTPGFANQYSAITGGGEGSPTYAVAFGNLSPMANQAQSFAFDPNDPSQLAQLPTITLPAGYRIDSLDVTNTTYAALSMLLGDSFAKKFGGPTGNDPDYFELSVYGTDSAGHSLPNSVDFSLADYRSANNALDYVVTSWQTVDLSSLAAATRLYFNLTSSDTGSFGMNTPAYFALGSMQLSAVPEPSSISLLLTAVLCAAAYRSRRNPLRRYRLVSNYTSLVQGSKMFHRFALALAVSVGLTLPASAGPYAGISGVTPGAPDNPIPRASFTTFESSVVNYSPAPGVGAGFQNLQTGVASLGELYSPVASPTGANTPFNKLYAPQTGTEPNAQHDGSAVFSPFDGNVNDPNDTYGFIGIDQPGSITLGFGVNKIVNGPGADFAVFENGFGFGGPTSLFAELAYVEVSSDGTHFARFPSISTNTAPTAVSGSFQGYDMTNVYDLAGKNAANWGTPFDLSELATNPLVTAGQLNLADVRYVRLVDVVGSGVINDANGNPIAGIARDSLGNPILDNWITYDSAGFDYVGLNTGAVGLVNFAPVPEPATAALLALGAGVLAAARRRRITR